MELQKSPTLINYIIKCGLKQEALVDHFNKIDTSNMNLKMLNESLAKNNMIPEIISMHPSKEDPNSPIIKNFVDVLQI